MTSDKAGLYWLPLAVALLAAPLGTIAQAPGAPPAPTAPPAPGGPAPAPTNPTPTNPPAPTKPTGPPPPMGGNGGPQAPVTPPPPPPTPPAPNAAAPAGAVPGGAFVPSPALPFPILPQIQAPDAANPPDVGSPGTLLRYKFRAGQTINYHLVVDSDGTVQMGAAGTGQPLKLHLEMALGQTVKSVDANGAATISEQIGGLTATLNGQAIPLPTQAQQQLQQPFTAVLTPTGQVLSIKTAAGTGAVPPTGFDPSQLSQLQGLPKNAVSAGDKWRSDVTSAVAGIETHIAYTLTGLSTDGSMATITQKVYEGFKPGTGGAGQAVPVKLNGTLTGTGTQQFDVAAGQIASQTNNLTLDMTVTPTTAGGQPVKTHMDITVSLQREAAPSGTPAAPTDEPPTAQLQ